MSCSGRPSPSTGSPCNASSIADSHRLPVFQPALAASGARYPRSPGLALPSLPSPPFIFPGDLSTCSSSWAALPGRSSGLLVEKDRGRRRPSWLAGNCPARFAGGWRRERQGRWRLGFGRGDVRTDGRYRGVGLFPFQPCRCFADLELLAQPRHGHDRPVRAFRPGKSHPDRFLLPFVSSSLSRHSPASKAGQRGRRSRRVAAGKPRSALSSMPRLLQNTPSST